MKFRNVNSHLNNTHLVLAFSTDLHAGPQPLPLRAATREVNGQTEHLTPELASLEGEAP